MKYYTPDISEFHVGFEYEAKDPITKQWIKMSVDAEYKTNPLWFASVNDTRVKYLDQEDIKSFGFVRKKEARKYAYYLERFGIRIATWDKYPIIDLKTLSPTLRMVKRIFRGYCKNKSELKKILIQTGVIKD